MNPPASAAFSSATAGSTASIDRRDRDILGVLADEPVAGVSAVAGRLGMARATVRARLRRMNESLLAEHALRIPPSALGLTVRAFARVRVSVAQQGAFLEDLRDIDEVVECLRLTGDSDVRVEVVLADLAGVPPLQARILRCRGVQRISIDVVLGELLPRRMSQLL